MNIYELLSDMFKEKPYRLSLSRFNEERKNQLEQEVDKERWEVIKNVSSLTAEVEFNSISFVPSYVFDGKRSFSIDDMDEHSFELLSDLEHEKLPTVIKARICDILWKYKQDYKMAIIATDAYYSYFSKYFFDARMTDILNAIKRALSISTQINQLESKKTSCEYLYNVLSDSRITSIMSLRVMEILNHYKYGNEKNIISFAEKIILKEQNIPELVGLGYEIKAECAKRMHDQLAINKEYVEYADYLVSFAEKMVGEAAQGALRSEQYFQKAIKLYRNNGASEKEKKTIRRLMDVQKSIPNSMKVFTHKYDVSEEIKSIDKNFEGLTFEESIIRLSQFVVFYKKEYLINQISDDLKGDPISHLFGKNLVNRYGQTVITIPPLTHEDIIEETSTLNLYMNQKIVENAQFVGGLAIKYIFEKIRKTYKFDESSLNFLTHNNAIIPEGREEIIRSGLFQVLQGRCYEGIHILAPQVENIFRNIAKEVDGVTIYYEDDGSSQEKVLGSIFEVPELIDSYDNDYLRLFRALLNEKSGANIRNEIAHGIVEKKEAESGVYLFFVGAVIKLLIFTSNPAIEILNSCNKLKPLIKPE